MLKKALIALVVVVAATFVVVALRRGVHVTVENGGRDGLENVVVRCAGSENEIGVLAPGESATVRLGLERTARRVEVTWTFDGSECYGRHDVYLEPSGYNGTVRIVIDGSSVSETDDDVATGFF